jgi:hypothetical protein
MAEKWLESSCLSGGWHGVAALQFVDSRMGSGNVTTRNFPSARGRWYTVRLRVTRPRIELSVDSEKLIDFLFRHLGVTK